MALERIERARAAAEAAVEFHRRIIRHVGPGVTLLEIDAQAERIIAELGAESVNKGYRLRGRPPFPSCVCLNVNDSAVHGSRRDITLSCGDLLKIDVGLRLRGMVGDIGWTYAVGGVNRADAVLMDAGRTALREGIARIRHGVTIAAFGRVVYTTATSLGFSVLDRYCGHGLGESMHMPPSVPNDGSGLGQFCEGMILAVEPMLAAGRGDVGDRGGWDVYTMDGSKAVLYEHNLTVTKMGCEVFSHGMWDLPHVIG